MKKIYITGIGGLLGGNIAYLLRNRYCVAGADVINVIIDNVFTETYDMLDTDLLNSAINRFKPDIIIHTVAAINVDKCEEDVPYAEKLNVLLTKKISEVCEAQGIKLIYISTDAVFDGKKIDLYNENDIVNPINIYGSTKLSGEQIVLKSRKNLVLRTNIYGFNIQNKYSFGEWILYSLIQDKTINMFDDIYFSPIIVNELTEIISEAIDKDLVGIYHACGTGSISKYEFAILLKEIFNIKTGNINKSSSETFLFKAKRSKNMGMSNTKLCNKLQITINTPEESLMCFKKLFDNGYVKKIKNLSEDLRDGN